MKTEYKRPLIIVVILVVGLLLSYLAITLKPAPEPRPPQKESPHPAEVVAVQLVERPVHITSQGTVTPKTAIDITSQVSGQVLEVADAFAAGGRFEAGQVLLRIDPRDYEIRIIQAESRLAEARRELALEAGQARQAEREWRELGNPEANALSLRKPQLAAAEAAVKAAEADLRQTRLDLERSAVSVPFDGRVVATEANLGQYVGAGTILGRVFASDIMEVRLPLTAQQMTLLNLKNVPGAFQPLPVTLRLRVGEQHLRWQGDLVRVESGADPDSRLYHVVVEVHGERDGQPPIMPGSFVEAEVLSNPFTDVAVLPRSALYQRNNLLVLDDERRLRVLPVSVLEVGPDQALVRGVAEGTLALTEPPVFLEIGALYRPIIADPPHYDPPDYDPGEPASAELFEAPDAHSSDDIEAPDSVTDVGAWGEAEGVLQSFEVPAASSDGEAEAGDDGSDATLVEGALP